jgi:hypothetical protein
MIILLQASSLSSTHPHTTTITSRRTSPHITFKHSNAMQVMSLTMRLRRMPSRSSPTVMVFKFVVSTRRTSPTEILFPNRTAEPLHGWNRSKKH